MKMVVLRYLKHTNTHGVVCKDAEQSNGYIDGDSRNCYIDQKAVNSYIFKLYGCIIS